MCVFKNQLRSGVIISYLNLVISSIIPFVYTPIMLSLLGQKEYGLYSLSHSAVAYLSLLSFGFGSTIIRYIAKYRAQEDKKAVQEAYGFFLALYCVLAMLVLVGGFIISQNVDSIFKKGLSIEELDKMQILVMIMALNSALSFPVSVFSSMVTAYERYVYRKTVDMLATIGAPLANLFALFLGYKSIGMAFAATFMQLLMLPLYAWYCYKVLNIRPAFVRLSKSLIKELLGFSLFVFIGSIVDMLFWATDKVILGMLAGSVAVAIYNIGGTFNTMVMNLSTSISGVLTPRITGMVIKEATKEQLTELFIKVGRLQFIIIGIIVSGFTVFGRIFITLWVGESYLEAYWVAVLTMFPLCIPLIQNTGLSIVMAQNKHQFRSIVYLIIAILNVVSTYCIIPYMGLIGAALCSCISYLLGQGLIMNIYYYKVTGINIPLFWKNILSMAIVPSLMLIVGLILNNRINIHSWLVFLMGVVLYSVIYALLMYRYILNDYEKDIFRKPFIALCKLCMKHTK